MVIGDLSSPHFEMMMNRHVIAYNAFLRSRSNASRVWVLYYSSEPALKLGVYDASRTYSSSEEQTILVIGDGDLSYSSSRALDCYNNGTKLIASVLETSEQHQSIYRDSVKNINHILSFGHEVRFNLDARYLSQHFDSKSTKFDRIQWNFPHYKGRTNARLNRALIRDFFDSSKHFLNPSTGQIHMALLDHQGGAYSIDNQLWKQSWMPARYAAETAGMLLTHVLAFQPMYNISSYQFRDKPFLSKGVKQMYIFSVANGQTVAPKDLQLFSVFTVYANQTHHHLFRELIRSNIPPQFRVETVIHPITSDAETSGIDFDNLAKYSIFLFSERKPITQQSADCLRIAIGQIISKFGHTSSWNASHVKPAFLRQYERMSDSANHFQ
jgi:hypothetical protein